MSLLARFTLAQKFLLVAGLGLLLALPPTLLWTQAQWQALQVAQQEAAGTAPTRATLRLVQLTQQHRGLSAAMLAGDAQAKTLRETKAREVQAALDQALQASAAYADPLAQRRREAVRDQWAALQADVAAARVQPAQSFARHGALVQAELAWVNDVVNLSGMALDPEPDSYHLIMVATAQLPMVTELMGQMRARGAAAIARGESSPEDAAMLGYTLRHLAQVRAGAALAMERVDLEAADARDVKRHWGQARAALEPVLALVNERLLPGRLDGLTRQAWWDASTRAIDAQFALLDAALTHLDGELAQRAADSRQALVVEAVGLLLGLGLASWAIGLTVRETHRTAQDTLQCLQALAQGDFTQAPQAQGRDEFARMAQALQQATTSLGSLVRELKANGESVGTAAQQIASGNADLSQRTELTASNLQQTAAAMHQINATLDASASHARQATELAASASAVAGRGGEAMDQVVGTMQDISTSARRIADIIGVIDGIAFQTNILALNAAVEAARAGEQGRGFAVVASEVRNLAQRSASAAREIKQLINDSLQRVHTGAEQVGGAGHTIQEIVAQVRSVAALIDQMSNATAQQSQGVAEVNQAVSQLDQATQQNAALVEESAAAAASLGQQAQVLLAAMQRFRVPG